MKAKPDKGSPPRQGMAHLTRYFFLFSLLLALLFAGVSHATETKNRGDGGGKYPPFLPIDPVMPLSQVKPGMKGEARTVIRGTEIVSFPVEILEIIARTGVPQNLIIIRIGESRVSTETGGVAGGMSGSPVYVNGKLVGAIGYGWNFSRHDMALVTPIEEMMAIWDNPERIPSFSPAPIIPDKPVESDDRSADHKTAASSQDVKSPGGDAEADAGDGSGVALDEPAEAGPRDAYLFVQGLSPRMAEEMGKLLGRRVAPFAGGSSGGEKRAKYDARIEPGAAVSTALAWGDVEISAMGTLTALSRDGRFVAFAHPFVDLGMTSAALLEAKVARVIPGLESPIKIGSTGDLIGIVTQDRPQGIGGRIGTFAPAASCTIRFTDIDAGRSFKRGFQMVQDPYQLSTIASTAIVGCIEDLWGRQGGGSAKITARFSGSPAVDSWDRTNIFISEKDVAREMMKEFTMLTQLFAMNQFQELRPFGIDVTVEMTQDPRVLYVEEVEVPKGTFHPGDTVSFDITLRPWRKAPFKRTYSLVIPQKVSGICELLVRGGGIAEENAEYMEAGWRSISSMPILLAELEAKETNDQIVLELRGQESLENQIKRAKTATPEDFMNDKLKSEQQLEKLKEGSMRVVRTNYYVDGLIHRLIKVEPRQGGDDNNPPATGDAGAEDDETGDAE